MDAQIEKISAALLSTLLADTLNQTLLESILYPSMLQAYYSSLLLIPTDVENRSLLAFLKCNMSSDAAALHALSQLKTSQPSTTIKYRRLTRSRFQALHTLGEFDLLYESPSLSITLQPEYLDLGWRLRGLTFSGADLEYYWVDWEADAETAESEYESYKASSYTNDMPELCVEDLDWDNASASSGPESEVGSLKRESYWDLADGKVRETYGYVGADFNEVELKDVDICEEDLYWNQYGDDCY